MMPAHRLGVASGGSEGGVAGRHKVQTLIIRATCPLRLLRTRGSDRRAELRLTLGSGQPLSTARWPPTQEPCESTEDREDRALAGPRDARPTNQGHQRMPTPNATRLVLPASTLNMIVVSGSDATRTHAPIHTGRLPQLNGTQRHSQVRGGTADQRSHTKCSQGISVPSGVPGIVLRRLTGNRVGGGVAPPPLTPPDMRARIRRFVKPFGRDAARSC